jgi:dodecin
MRGMPGGAGSSPHEQCITDGRCQIPGGSMTDHVYRVTEIVGSSTDGIDQAIRNAVARASETLRNLDWFEVVSIRGHLSGSEIEHTQVTIKVGFRLEEQ